MSACAAKLRSASGEEALLAAARWRARSRGRPSVSARAGASGRGARSCWRLGFLAAPMSRRSASFSTGAARSSGHPPSRLLASEGLGFVWSAARCSAALPSAWGRGGSGAAASASATSIVTLAASDRRSASRSLKWARAALADGEWTVREAAVAVLADSTAHDAGPMLSKLL